MDRCERARLVSGKPEDAVIPDEVLSDPRLSLVAKGLYALALSEQGKPINPYEDAVEANKDIHAAIEELVTARLILRVAAP